MPGGYIGEADILIGADATNIARDVQRQAASNLKNAGAQLGGDFAKALGKNAAASVTKSLEPLTGTVKKTATAAVAALKPAARPIQDFVSGFKSAEAAASSFTGKLGKLGGQARSALQPALTAVGDFRKGFANATDGLSSFTGKWGALGVAAKASTALASSSLKLLARAAAPAWTAIKAGADKAWQGLKDGALKASKAAGEAIKTNIGAAAKGTAAVISGVLGVAFTKGFNRLNSLNQAEARLTGLGLAGKQLESVMDSASKSVDGTAFSMADAANAAGLLSSAGTAAGKDMDQALKALVATTAASGREMSEVTPIFAKMQAAGKVTGETMAQMLDAGINANGALQKTLNKSSEEITKMVTAGEIDFKTFTEAINNDLSMLAAAMGGTLGGMVSNIGAAMGRIGAEVQKPIFDALLIAMPGLLDLIKRLADSVKAFMEPLQGSLNSVGEKLAETFERIQPSAEGIDKFVDSLGPLLPVLGAVLASSGGLLATLPGIGPLFAGLSGPVGLAAGALAALTMVDPSSLAKGFENIGGFLADKLPKMLEGLVGLIQTGLENLVENLPVMLQGLTDIILLVLQSIIDVLPTLIPVLVNAVGQLVPALILAILGALPLLLNAAMSLFGGLVSGLLQTIPSLVTTLVASIPMLVDALVAAVPLLLDGALAMFTGILDALVTTVPLVIDALVAAIPVLIESLVTAVPKIIDGAIAFFLGIVTALTSAVPQILTALVNAIPVILTALIDAIPTLIDTSITMFLSLITGLLTALPDIIGAVIGMIPVIVTALIEAIPQIIEAAFTLFLGLIDGLIEAIPQILKAIKDELLPGLWNAITGGGDKAEETGKGLGDRAASGLSQTASEFSTQGAALGASATAGLSGTQESLALAAGGLGSTASASLGAHATDMSAAAAGLGKGAVTGLSGETKNAQLAAADLANAATIDVASQTASATTAGKNIAKAFSKGLSDGKTGVAAATASVASSAQAGLSKIDGFIAVGKGLTNGIVLGILQGRATVAAALANLVAVTQGLLTAGVVNSIGGAFAALWSGKIAPTLTAMRASFASSTANIAASWARLGASIARSYAASMQPIFDRMMMTVRVALPEAFRQGVNGIISQWERIREAAARPARFVVNTVMNGMIGAMNKIPGVNVPRISGGFARGGILPGMSSMANGDDQLIMARRGEGMLVSEALRTSADRSAFLAANAAGRRGVGFASMLQGFARGGLVNPLPRGSYRVSQPYHGGHNGIDLAAAMGTKIYAAAKGIVRLASSVPMGGNEVYIQHANGLGTRYSHMSSFAAKVGQMVRANQVIGKVGSTGMSTGPHLHYMVHNPGGGPGNYGNHVNPAPFLGMFGSEVDGYLDDMRAVAKGYKESFARSFPSSNMFNAAAGGAMVTGINGMLGYAKGHLGTDQGRTGSSVSAKLYDRGGMIPHGGVGVNLSGRPEAVLTYTETQGYKSMLNAVGSAGRAGTGATGATGTKVSATLVFDQKVSGRVFKDIAEQFGAAFVKGFTGSQEEALSTAKKLTDSLKTLHTNYWQDIADQEQKVISLRSKLDEKKNGKLTAAARNAAREQLKLAEQELKAMRGVDREKQLAKLTQAARAQEAAIGKLAGQREVLADKIKDAQEKLNAATALRNDWVTNLQQGVVGKGSIAGISTSGGMIRNLERTIKQTQSFNDSITKLKQMGLSDEAIKQLTQEFQTSGSSRAADRLAAGGAEEIKRINELQKQLESEAKNLATKTGDMLYKAGIDSAKGFYDGLVKQDKALEAAAKKLADAITNQIKKSLKIKSPSRVMMSLGSNTGEGFVLGTEKWIGAAESAYADLVTPPGGLDLPTGREGAGAATVSAGARQVVIERGAVEVHEAGDVRRTAIETVDRIIEEVELGGL